MLYRHHLVGIRVGGKRHISIKTSKVFSTQSTFKNIVAESLPQHEMMKNMYQPHLVG
jgi:hypothetical protein